jgi:hypothetical protein
VIAQHQRRIQGWVFVAANRMVHPVQHEASLRVYRGFIHDPHPLDEMRREGIFYQVMYINDFHVYSVQANSANGFRGINLKIAIRIEEFRNSGIKGLKVFCRFYLSVFSIPQFLNPSIPQFIGFGTSILNISGVIR